MPDIYLFRDGASSEGAAEAGDALQALRTHLIISCARLADRKREREERQLREEREREAEMRQERQTVARPLGVAVQRPRELTHSSCSSAFLLFCLLQRSRLADGRTRTGAEKTLSARSQPPSASPFAVRFLRRAPTVLYEKLIFNFET